MAAQTFLKWLYELSQNGSKNFTEMVEASLQKGLYKYSIKGCKRVLKGFTKICIKFPEKGNFQWRYTVGQTRSLAH